MPFANSQISMRSHADRWSVSIGVPLYLQMYLSSVSQLNYLADWSLRSHESQWRSSEKGRLWSDCKDVQVDLNLHFLRSSSVYNSFNNNIATINWPKIWFEQTKAGLKCPEIGHEMSKNWVRVDFGRKVKISFFIVRILVKWPTC